MMRLHLLIDYEDSKGIEEGDIVFVSTRNRTKLPDGVKVKYRINWQGSDSCDNRDYVNSVFRRLPEEYSSCTNTAFAKFFMPAFNILQNVEDLLNEYKVDGIVLYGGSKKCFFSATEAEGEGIRKKYQTNWMVNRLLFDIYYKDYPIEWRDRESSLFVIIRNFIHSAKRSVKDLLSEIIFSIKDINYSNATIPKDVRTFTIVDLPQQYNNLKYLSIVLNINNLQFYTRNKLLSKSIESVTYIPAVSPLEVLAFWVKMILKPISSLTFYGVKSYRLKSEIDYLLFQYQLKEKRILNFFSNYELVPNGELLTDMTFGFDIISSHALTKFGIKHKNYQYVSMGRVLYPNLEVADEYYVYSRKTQDFYNLYSNSFHFYFPLIEEKNKETYIGPVRVTYFLQPDDIVYDFLELMQKSLPILSKMNCEVCVKPHYRQNEMDKIRAVCDGYSNVTIVGLNKSVEQILKSTDVAICIHSSVIFEAMSHFVMSLIYNPLGKYNKNIYEFDVCFPEVNFVIDKAEQIREYIDNYSEYKDFFEKRLRQYIQTNVSIEPC